MTDWRDEAKALAAQSRVKRRIGARARKTTRAAIKTIKQAEANRQASAALLKALRI